ncbi:hypothetical protein ACOMHN_008910 [Nucella lapillus]
MESEEVDQASDHFTPRTPATAGSELDIALATYRAEANITYRAEANTIYRAESPVSPLRVIMMSTVGVLALAVVLPSAFGLSPVPPCNNGCIMMHDPQCATVVIEFGNGCSMDAAACRLNKEGFAVSGVTNGSCPSSDRRRDSPLVRAMVNQAAARRQADAEECAPVACTRQYDPVCATYTGTFSNQCVLDSALCR